MVNSGKEHIYGLDVSSYTYEQIIEQIRMRMNAQEKSTIIAVNPEKVMAAQHNEELRELINQSTFQIPDGIGIILASKLNRGTIRTRVTGVDFMYKLLEMAALDGKKVFLYGAKEETVKTAASNIKVAFPSINVVGTMNGYVEDEDLIVERINESGAEILFVALGSPKQELWIRRNLERLQVSTFQGVGGSFDVFAGTVQRAPAPFRKVGLEWLYRLISNPSRLKRQLALVKFLWRMLTEKNTKR